MAPLGQSYDSLFKSKIELVNRTVRTNNDLTSTGSIFILSFVHTPLGSLIGTMSQQLENCYITKIGAYIRIFLIKIISKVTDTILFEKKKTKEHIFQSPISGKSWTWLNDLFRICRAKIFHLDSSRQMTLSNSSPSDSCQNLAAYCHLVQKADYVQKQYRCCLCHLSPFYIFGVIALPLIFLCVYNS